MADQSTTQTLVGDVLRLTRDCVIAIAGGALVALFVFGKEQLLQYDFTQPLVLSMAGITAGLIALGFALTLRRERRRRA